VSFRPVYLDASAIVKLVAPEPESGALVEALGEWTDPLSSALAEVEVHRALWRVRAPRAVHARADQVLSSLVLVRLEEPILARASALKYPSLRPGDAIHLATALSIGDDPEAFITYDARLAAAARRQRLNVRHPGASAL
jgi:predicted nucleic acid-binding protein